jgi:hypothetical protein
LPADVEVHAVTITIAAATPMMTKLARSFERMRGLLGES